MPSPTAKWRVWIDTGGTFTDCFAIDPAGTWYRCKVLSHSALRGKIVEYLSPKRLRVNQNWDAPFQFIADFNFQLLEQSHKKITVTSFDPDKSEMGLSAPLPRSLRKKESFEVTIDLEAPVLATHLVTNTPCDQNLPEMRMRLATTKGTNALLEYKGTSPAFFTTEGYGDLLEIGNQQRKDLFTLKPNREPPLYDRAVEVPERLDAKGNPLQSPKFGEIESKVDELLAKGIDTAAISFMHGYKNSAHEWKLADWLQEKGFRHVSISSDVSPLMKIVPRAQTTLVDAYLNPVIRNYLTRVREHLRESSLYVMTSAGGLVHADTFHPKDSLLSGPAGGVVGASAVGRQAGFNHIVSFDMGGTSTDVSRYDDSYDYVFEHHVGETHLAAPALAIETVAAGGGSLCSFDGRALTVGPESAGADPGPACYGAGGPLTLTDVNLLLGRLDPANFGFPVDWKTTEQRFTELKEELETHSAGSDRSSVLKSFLDIANERMADAIRKISIRKGYDIRKYAMVGFGGAGGQHACAIARRLGMENVLIPPDAGLLSAYGLGRASVEKFAERQVLESWSDIQSGLKERVRELENEAADKMRKESITDDQIEIQRRLVFMRIEGQESTLEIEYEGQNLAEAFRKKYETRYGHWMGDRSLEVESIRVVASSGRESDAILPGSHIPSSFKEPSEQFTKTVEFDGGPIETPVYWRKELLQGTEIEGPALVLDPYSTLVIEPGWNARTLEDGHLHLKFTAARQSVDPSLASTVDKPEAAMVELFTNRFSSIAEEMGEMLQRTALSVNVKERLDFSCALLDAEGHLVVNAPHIPVHLGALGLCVREVSQSIDWQPGDVVVTNHPGFGGSHLPDVTVLTPVFNHEEELAGFAACRAHHAEIGGSRPGSMPPLARSLAEEGVVIPPTHLLEQGKSQWQKIRTLLEEAPYPSRSVEENIADLRAAVAANQRGKTMLENLLQKEGTEKLQYYMDAIRQRAAHKMKTTIRSLENGQYRSTEYLDDQTPLVATIDVEDEAMHFDFTGTGEQHSGNLNATPAIVRSVITYFLRLLINEPLPLNEGLLESVGIHIPNGLLNPDFKEDDRQSPAVVGGNTETSQRLVDTLLKPFQHIACSQGTMNNILFGNDDFGYYETIGGGTGAGPGFHGADAVHHHMTNTRATDPEILEYRYPIRLLKYGIRPHSGGEGKYTGGRGIHREYLFLDAVELSVLTQHRTNAPYGLKGGRSGSRGLQFLIRNDGSRQQLNSIDGTSVKKGDRLVVQTPGGGGFGEDTG